MATVTCLPQVVVEVAWDLCRLRPGSIVADCTSICMEICFACSWCLGYVSNLGIWHSATTQLQTSVSPHLSAAAYHFVCSCLRNKSSLTSLQWFCSFLSRLHTAYCNHSCGYSVGSGIPRAICHRNSHKTPHFQYCCFRAACKTSGVGNALDSHLG